MNLLEWITDIALVVLVAAVMLFIVFYAVRSPWRATLQGQFLMAQKVSMALLALHFLIGAIWHYPGFWDVQAALVCFLAITSFVMLVGLLLAQTEQRPVPKKHGTGFVPPEDLESTLQTRRRRRP